MSSDVSVSPPGGDLHRGLSITLPPPAERTTPDLSPRSTLPATTELQGAPEVPDSRQSGYCSDHSEHPDAEAIEETTPRTSFSSGTCTPPKQPLRRTSGRRPLSVMSSSSMNSDTSPLIGQRVPLHETQGHHGLGVSYTNQPTPNRAMHQTPDPYSPGKHRRHRSMIAAPIDYRTHYTSPQYTQPLYVNYTPRPQHDPSASPNPGAYHHNFSSFGQSHGHYGSSGPFGQYGQTYGHGSYPSPGQSPLFEGSPLSSTSPLHIPQSPGYPHSDTIQDLFVAMAYHERQVLEARQNYEAKTEALNAFKRNVKAMIAPSHERLCLPCRPTIISRRHCPNVGIHALSYSARRPHAPSIQIVTWRVDNEVSPALDDEMCDEDYGTEEPVISDGLALRIVKCLLGIVHCIISTLPVHQRDFATHQAYLKTNCARPFLTWTAEYPLPMETLFGYLAYEA